MEHFLSKISFHPSVQTTINERNTEERENDNEEPIDPSNDHWWDLFSFFLFGCCNQFPAIVIINAAQLLLSNLDDNSVSYFVCFF